jgi:Pentapeptide repeats (8 copies)
MRTGIHREKPGSWREQKLRSQHVWTLPFWGLEWVLAWVAFALSRWSFLQVLEYLEGFSVLVAVIFYFSESGDRLKQKHYQAWQVINTAQGKGGNGGRIEALQELNNDRCPLVGVDASGAYLQDIHLQRARLVRANFSGADLRDSDFSFADLTDADLASANFRQSHLNGAGLQADLSGGDLTGAHLADADLRNSNLANLRWRGIADIQNANILGVKNAPEGFLAWARQHGAMQSHSDAR